MRLYYINLILVIASLIINIIASVVMLKKKPLKPFQVTFINILLLNILYAISRLPIVLIFVTSPKHNILDNKNFTNFRILIAVFIIHTICFFVTFLAFQRLIAVTYPIKFPTWITKKNILKLSITIYVTTTIGFSVCTVLIVKSSIRSVQVDRALCWLFVMESLFIVISYAIIIWKTTNFRFRSSLAKQEYRLVKISLIVSISFLLSYFPITLYLILKDLSYLFYQIAEWMIWIDNFVNPLVIILDNHWSCRTCKLIADNDSNKTLVQLTTKSNVNFSVETALWKIERIHIIKNILNEGKNFLQKVANAKWCYGRKPAINLFAKFHKINRHQNLNV